MSTSSQAYDSDPLVLLGPCSEPANLSPVLTNRQREYRRDETMRDLRAAKIPGHEQNIQRYRCLLGTVLTETCH